MGPAIGQAYSVLHQTLHDNNGDIDKLYGIMCVYLYILGSLLSSSK